MVDLGFIWNVDGKVEENLGDYSYNALHVPLHHEALDFQAKTTVNNVSGSFL